MKWSGQLAYAAGALVMGCLVTTAVVLAFTALAWAVKLAVYVVGGWDPQ